MKWIKRKLVNWLMSVDNEPFPYRGEGRAIAATAKDLDNNRIDMDRAIKFSVLPAAGGCVVEVRIWDQKNHEWCTKAHIIPEGDDVAHSVGQIVAMEFLRR